VSEAGLKFPHAEGSKPDGREGSSGIKRKCASPTPENYSWRFVALP